MSSGILWVGQLLSVSSTVTFHLTVQEKSSLAWSLAGESEPLEDAISLSGGAKPLMLGVEFSM